MPALIAVNSSPHETQLSRALRGLCRDQRPRREDGARPGAPDAVLEEDVSQILDAFATPDESLFVPLAVAIGAPGGGEGDYLGAERYVARGLQGDDSAESETGARRGARRGLRCLGEGQRLRG